MTEWLRLILPSLLSFAGAYYLAMYNSRHAAERAARSEADKIREERDRTARQRDDQQMANRKDIEFLLRENEDRKHDNATLFTTIREMSSENARGFGEINGQLQVLLKFLPQIIESVKGAKNA